MKNDEKQKVINTFLVALLCINTLCVFMLYMLMDKKFDSVNSFIVQSMQQSDNSVGETSLKSTNIEMPEPLFTPLGEDNAPIELTLISDIECPYCQKLYSEMFPDLTEGYISKGLLKLNFIPYPLESIHPKAMPASLAALSANQQGKLWPMFFYLSDNIATLSDEGIENFVRAEGMSFSSFVSEYRSEDNVKKIRSVKSQYKDLGIAGTPGIIINDKRIENFKGYGDLKNYINGELKAKTPIVSSLSVNEMIQNNPEIAVLDVRTDKEFSEGHIADVLHLDVRNLEVFTKGLESLNPEIEYIVYCKSGTRSTEAYYLMKRHGFKTVYNMAGGFDEWMDLGLKTVQ